MALRQVILSQAQDAGTVRFLDYGCGDGKYFHYLVLNDTLGVKNVHGEEVSSRHVERCREMGWLNVRLIAGADTLPCADETFDVVNMMGMIVRITVEQGGAHTVSDFLHILRAGGIRLISPPNYPIKRFYDWSDALRHRS